MKKVVSDHIYVILSHLPKSPGVYQMKDASGKVIYVGKAKSLKSRVNSYFLKTNELTLAKRQMVDKIQDIEIIICATEVEALVLETNLIKHLTPKYNILMKDDKNLAYLKITNSPVSELVKTRIKTKDGGEYFGPYVAGAEQCARALRRIFKIRNCRMKFSRHPSNLLKERGYSPDSQAGGDDVIITDRAGRTPPCMDYYIGLCPAPCLLDREKISLHDTHIGLVRDFLKGNTTEVFLTLQDNMKKYAKNTEFEKAQEIKDSIEVLKGLGERQSVRDVVEGNIDIFIKYEKYDKVYVVLTQVRSSQIVGVFRHEIENGEDEDIAVQFLSRQYMVSELGEDNIPDILLLKEEIRDESFLEFLRSKKIALEYPQIGPKNDLLNFTLTQIREYAYKRQMATLENNVLTREHMSHVLNRLGYESPQKGDIIFECYDISHTDGHFTYASRVAIVNGKPDPSRYKKYKIKTLEDGMIDDFASHREVMMRRALEGFSEKNFPHLIIIDGGKGQLSSAISGVNEGRWKYQNLSHPLTPFSSEKIDPKTSAPLGESQDKFIIPLCSIAKREEEIFLPSQKVPILFEHGTPEMMVLQKARDESHRFSITANKSARMKSMKKNILEEIPGIGPLTRKKLLKIAGTIENIKNISLEDMKKICTTSQIEALKDHGFFGH